MYRNPSEHNIREALQQRGESMSYATGCFSVLHVSYGHNRILAVRKYNPQMGRVNGKRSGRRDKITNNWQELMSQSTGRPQDPLRTIE